MTPTERAELIARVKQRVKWRAAEKPSVSTVHLNLEDAVAIIALAEHPVQSESFQSRVAPWMQETFGPEISADKVERGDRFVEEVYELLQWLGYDRRRLSSIENYVWARPVGEGDQEVGGVMVTLAAFCLAAGLDMHDAAETELARIWTKVEQIRAKQAAKPKHGPLPAQPENQIGASEHAVGQWVYRRIESLMGAKIVTSIRNELAYLNELVYLAAGSGDGEEYGSAPPSPPPAQWPSDEDVERAEWEKFK